MNAPVKRIIERVGEPVDVINSGSTGGRDFPTETTEGTVRMVIEQRGQPLTVTDSSGTEHTADMELRAVPDDDAPAIHGPGEGANATILDHPRVGRLQVVKTFWEDSDVLVINAVED